MIRPDMGRGRQMLSRDYTALGWSPDGRQIAASGLLAKEPACDTRREGSSRPGAVGNGRVARGESGLRDERWMSAVVERCAPPPGFGSGTRLLRRSLDDSNRRQRAAQAGRPAGVLALGAGSLLEWAPDGRALAYNGARTSVLASRPRYKGIVLVSLTGRKVMRAPLRNGAEPHLGPRRSQGCVYPPRAYLRGRARWTWTAPADS